MKKYSKIFLRYTLLIVVGWLALFVGQISAQSSSFKVGAATKIITPELGKWLQGATVLKRVQKVHDNLEANAIYFSDSKTDLLIVSCDLVGLQPEYIQKVRSAMGVASGIFPRNIIITETHTHGGPSLVPTNRIIPLNWEYMKKLKGWLINLAKEAVQSARPAKIGWATGKALVSWNRRLTWTDGTHTMHGDYTRPDFAGLEGPQDPQLTALFAKDMDGKLLAIMYNDTAHPTTVYSAGVWSSDFPGYTRKKLRVKFGIKNLPVLFLNGAQGDVERNNAFHLRQNETMDEQIKRLGNKMYKEIIRQYHEITYYNEEPTLKHTYKDLKVKVRLPTPRQLEESYRLLSQVEGDSTMHGLKYAMAYGTVELQEKFGKAPFDILPIHAIRIGKLAIVTEPCELYCSFGLNIKRRSPTLTTMVVGLADGYHGYVPTIYGLMGGGYSGRPIYWTRLEPYAGYKIVETGSILINKLFPFYQNTDYKEIAPADKSRP